MHLEGELKKSQEDVMHHIAGLKRNLKNVKSILDIFPAQFATLEQHHALEDFTSTLQKQNIAHVKRLGRDYGVHFFLAF